MLVEMYVTRFQGGPCSTSQDKDEKRVIADLAARGSEAVARFRMGQQVTTLIEQMREELQATSWRELLEKKLKGCG
jgi:hypothetical protein